MLGTQVGYVYDSMPPDAVRLMPRTGPIVALRYELRYPFAAWLVRQAVEAAGAAGGMGGGLGLAGAGSPKDSMRRYEVAHVQRQVGGSQHGAMCTKSGCMDVRMCWACDL